jgi:hypothetical protein
MTQFILCLQNETSRPILTKLPDFFLLQHAEGLAREIFAADLFRAENAAMFHKDSYMNYHNELPSDE